MKKTVLTCALVICATIGSFAQDSKPGLAPASATAPMGPMVRPQSNVTQAQRSHMMAENQARAFERQYNLTPEQYKGVFAACIEFANKLDASRASGKQTSQKDFEALMDEKDAKFKQVMTPEQYAKYETTRTHSFPKPGASPTINK